METLTTFRVILHIGLMIFQSIVVSCIIWSFSGIFTQKRGKRMVVTIIIVLASAYASYHVFFKKAEVVQMQEDVLYVAPKSHIK